MSKTKITNRDREWFLNILSNSLITSHQADWGSYFTYKSIEYGPFETNDVMISKAMSILKG